MKKRIFLTAFLSTLSVIFIVGCVSTPAKKKRSAMQQHSKADAAFDELEGRQTVSNRQTEKTSHEEPKSQSNTSDPVYTEKNEPIDLSSSLYLTAKGYGASKPGAIRQAKAELSNIFESRISSEVSSKVRQVTDSIKGSSFNKDIQSKIRVESAIELEGIIVGPVKKAHGEYEAVVGIDKQRAKEKWGNSIRNIDAQIDILINKSNTAQSKIQKLIPLKKTLSLWVQKESVLSRIRVLGYSSEFPQKDLKPILTTISNLKSEMLIDLNVTGDYGKTVRDNVAEILTNNGFKIGSGANTDLSISGSVKTKQLTTNNPRFKFSRAFVSLNIIDTSNNSQVGQIAENVRGAGLNFDEAGHNAVKKVYKKVAKKLIQYFN